MSPRPRTLPSPHHLAIPLVAFLVAALAFTSPWLRGDASADKKPQNLPGQIIEQIFDGDDKTETAWRVEWDTGKPWGFFIREAHFRRGAGEPFIQVLGDARLSQMFVPYHAGSPRIYDINPFASLDPVFQVHAGPNGKPGPKVASDYGQHSVFIQELRDTGPAHIKQRGTGKAPDFLEFRRGQALVLWAVYDTGNYDYIVEYGFHDDGMVSMRVGASGFNAFAWEPHMHTASWRVDVDLAGADHDSVLVVEHHEPGTLAATDTALPFNGGVEGFHDWEAERFTMLRVRDELAVNAYGRPISYDVMPHTRGSARHYGAGEAYTLHDFWATANTPGELDVRSAPSFVADGASVMDTDVVLWVQTAAHHHPRSEDLAYPNEPNVIAATGAQGATRVMWSGFDLRPRDLFDQTPLIGPREK